MSIGRVNSLCPTPDGLRRCVVRAQIQGGLPLTRLLNRSRHAAALRERVRAVVKGAGFRYPLGRVTLDVEMPAGGVLDDRHALPLALAILVASDQAPLARICEYRWLGQMNLDGSVQPIGLDWAAACANVPRLAGGEGLPYHLRSLRVLTPESATAATVAEEAPWVVPGWPSQLATWTLAGGHSALIYGEPGAGKSRWSQAICRHWRDAPKRRARRAAKRVFAKPNQSHVEQSWRVPVGASARQLAHWQHLQRDHVIALDDLALHSKGLRDALAERMDDEPTTATIATANPCPCGWHGSARKPCRCSGPARDRWLRQLPPPVIDRFDLVTRYEYSECAPTALDMAPIRRAWDRQTTRQGCLNGQLHLSGLDEVFGLGSALRRTLRLHGNALGFSGRAQLKCALLARTLADLDSRERLREDDLQTALGLRASPHEG